MSWNSRIRRTHRVLSIVFTVCVLANFAINLLFPANEQLSLAVGGFTLVPLFLLLFSGLYLFVLPYRRRRSDEA